eukprot:gb/GECG01011572.1/.p1 GENE.gb/GECG01011572.1/~~gb/GECG01011572.1/.p1  ORF type:complete len:2455 (+),score=290.31 gb/GECG01011572.1/:1-7365(+)
MSKPNTNPFTQQSAPQAQPSSTTQNTDTGAPSSVKSPGRNPFAQQQQQPPEDTDAAGAFPSSAAAIGTPNSAMDSSKKGMNPFASPPQPQTGANRPPPEPAGAGTSPHRVSWQQSPGTGTSSEAVPVVGHQVTSFSSGTGREGAAEEDMSYEPLSQNAEATGGTNNGIGEETPRATNPFATSAVSPPHPTKDTTQPPGYIQWKQRQQQSDERAPEPLPANAVVGSRGVVMEEEKTYYFKPNAKQNEGNVAQMRFWRPSLESLAFSKISGPATVTTNPALFQHNTMERVGLGRVLSLNGKPKEVFLKLRGAQITATANHRDPTPLFHIPLNPTTRVFASTRRFGSPPTNDIISALYRALPRTAVSWEEDGSGHFFEPIQRPPSGSKLPLVLELWTDNPISGRNNPRSKTKLMAFLQFSGILQYFQWADAIDNVIHILRGNFSLPMAPAAPPLTRVLPTVYDTRSIRASLYRTGRIYLTQLEDSQAGFPLTSRMSLTSNSATIVWNHPSPERSAERITEFIMQVFLEDKLFKTLRMPFFQMQSVTSSDLHEMPTESGCICLDYATDTVARFAEQSTGGVHRCQPADQHAPLSHLLCANVHGLESNSIYNFRILSVNRFGYSSNGLGSSPLACCRTMKPISSVTCTAENVISHSSAFVLRWTVETESEEANIDYIGGNDLTSQEKELYSPFTRLLHSIGDKSTPPDGFTVEVTLADSEQLAEWIESDSLPLLDWKRFIHIPIGVACRTKACLDSYGPCDNFVMQHEEFRELNSLVRGMRASTDQNEMGETDHSVSFGGLVDGLAPASPYVVRLCTHSQGNFSPFSEEFGPFWTLGPPSKPPPVVTEVKEEVSASSVSVEVHPPELGELDAPLEGMEIYLVQANSAREVRKIMTSENCTEMFDRVIKQRFEDIFGSESAETVNVGRLQVHPNIRNSFAVKFIGLASDSPYYVVSRAFNAVAIGPFTRHPTQVHTLGPPTVPPEPPFPARDLSGYSEIPYATSFWKDCESFGNAVPQDGFDFVLNTTGQHFSKGVGIDCVWIDWKEAEHGNHDAPIGGYEVGWLHVTNDSTLPDDASGCQTVTCTGGSKETRMCVQGIKPASKVSFCVRAWNEVGFGPYSDFSEPVQLLLPPKIVPSLPVFCEKRAAEASDLIAGFRARSTLAQDKLLDVVSIFDTSRLELYNGTGSHSLKLVADIASWEKVGVDEAPYEAVAIEYGGGTEVTDTEAADTDALQGRLFISLESLLYTDGEVSITQLDPGAAYVFSQRYFSGAGVGERSSFTSKIRTLGAPETFCPSPAPVKASGTAIDVCIASANDSRFLRCGSADAPYEGFEIEYEGTPLDDSDGSSTPDRIHAGSCSLWLSSVSVVNSIEEMDGTKSLSSTEHNSVCGFLVDGSLYIRIPGLRSLYRYTSRIRLFNNFGNSTWSGWSERNRLSTTLGPPRNPPSGIKVEGITLTQDASISVVPAEFAFVTLYPPALGEFEGAIEGVAIRLVEVSTNSGENLSESLSGSIPGEGRSENEIMELIRAVESDQANRIRSLKIPLSRVRVLESGAYQVTVPDLEPGSWYFVQASASNKLGNSPLSALEPGSLFFARGVPVSVHLPPVLCERSARSLVIEHGKSDQQDIVNVVREYLQNCDGTQKTELLNSGCPTHAVFDCFRKSSKRAVICSEEAELAVPGDELVDGIGKVLKDAAPETEPAYLPFVATAVARLFCYAKVRVRNLIPGNTYIVEQRFQNDTGSSLSSAESLEATTVAEPLGPPETEDLVTEVESSEGVYMAETVESLDEPDEQFLLPPEPSFNMEADTSSVEHVGLYHSINLSNVVKYQDRCVVSVRIGLVSEAVENEEDEEDEEDGGDEANVSWFITWLLGMQYYIDANSPAAQLSLPFQDILKAIPVRSQIDEFRQLVNDPANSRWMNENSEVSGFSRMDLRFLISLSVATDASSSQWSYDFDLAHPENDLRSANFVLTLLPSDIPEGVGSTGDDSGTEDMEPIPGGASTSAAISSQSDTNDATELHATNAGVGAQQQSTEHTTETGYESSAATEKYANAGGQHSLDAENTAEKVHHVENSGTATTHERCDSPGNTGDGTSELPPQRPFQTTSRPTFAGEENANADERDRVVEGSAQAEKPCFQRASEVGYASTGGTQSIEQEVAATVAPSSESTNVAQNMSERDAALNFSNSVVLGSQQAEQTCNTKTPGEGEVLNKSHYGGRSVVTRNRDGFLTSREPPEAPTGVSGDGVKQPERSVVASDDQDLIREPQTTGNKEAGVYMKEDSSISVGQAETLSARPVETSAAYGAGETNPPTSETTAATQTAGKVITVEGSPVHYAQHTNGDKIDGIGHVEESSPDASVEHEKQERMIKQHLKEKELAMFQCPHCHSHVASGMGFCNYCGLLIPFGYHRNSGDPLYMVSQISSNDTRLKTCSVCSGSLAGHERVPRFCIHCGEEHLTGLSQGAE